MPHRSSVVSVVLAGFLLNSVAGAATLTVNTLSDADDANDSVCSLREAITAANTDANYQDCTGTGYGNDTIHFSISGTILLSSTLPAVTDPAGLTIDGTGQTITVSGNHAVRVMRVNGGAQLTLEHLTVADGSGGSGGGISINNTGTLTVSHSTFSGNSASTSGGGIYNDGGTLAITHSTFSAQWKRSYNLTTYK